MINGNVINKNFKIYDFCNYDFFNSITILKKGSLFYDYINIKINNMNEKEKEKIISIYSKITGIILDNLSIEYDELIDDYNKIILDIVLKQQLNLKNKNIEEILDTILENNNYNYLIIYDSKLLNIPSNDKIIAFDINKNFELKKYNLFYLNSLTNINIEIIVENMMQYWPLPIISEHLFCYINNNFFNIINKNLIKSEEEKEVILAKLCNNFYNLNININYIGNNNTIKSFLDLYNCK